MASGGHNRKSRSQAERDGTARPDRHKDPVVIAPGDVVKPPGLSDAAADAWDRWIQPRVELGFYEPAEAPMLGLWCSTLVRALGADKATPIHGLLEYEDAYGNMQVKKHPGLTAFIQSSAEFRALSARLGLDPLARLALADLRQGGGESEVGPQLPEGAPPAFKPRVVGG